MLYKVKLESGWESAIQTNLFSTMVIAEVNIENTKEIATVVSNKFTLSSNSILWKPLYKILEFIQHQITNRFL